MIACNTAHILASEIEYILETPVISLPKLTGERLEQLGLSKIGLLASPTTVKSTLFDGNHKLIYLSKSYQKLTENLIRAVIAGKANDVVEKFSGLISMFNIPVILGCTELSVLNNELKAANVIDPLDLVVERIFHG